MVARFGLDRPWFLYPAITYPHKDHATLVRALAQVPDALLVGRWTDGAVVAVRHDASRFPLVERARQRLGALGIPILGAVVNGCRPAESAYGAYGYYGSDPAATDGDES